MENTIVLNSAQKIEVLFQDEVSLDIDCSLVYVKSGEKEISSYVTNVAQPTLAAIIETAETEMAVQIANGVETAKISAANAAAEAINTSITTAENTLTEYVGTNIIPVLDEKLLWQKRPYNKRLPMLPVQRLPKVRLRTAPNRHRHLQPKQYPHLMRQWLRRLRHRLLPLKHHGGISGILNIRQELMCRMAAYGVTEHHTVKPNFRISIKCC